MLPMKTPNPKKEIEEHKPTQEVTFAKQKTNHEPTTYKQFPLKI